MFLLIAGEVQPSPRSYPYFNTSHVSINRQTNVETPLSTIEQALENVMNRGGYGGLNPKISLNVDGQEFARLTLQDILQEASRQGYNVEVLGVV